MPFWHRAIIAFAVVAAAVILAKLIDRRMARRTLPPEAATRYRVLRRSLVTAIVTVGVLSALLVIPQVRAVAGGILASSAVVGLIVGFASRSTLANFIAGILIAFTQPVRLGDRVEIGDTAGTVEEIGLTYTFIKTDANARLIIPNERLASDTIRNSTIVSPEKLAEITVQVPLNTDLGAVVDLLRSEAAAERDPEVFVSALAPEATVTLRAWTDDEEAAAKLEAELRLRVHARLRANGIYS